MINNERLNALITLLADQDSNVSCPAMAEILRQDAMDNELDGVLADLQESRTPSLRRKSHQMQVIRKIRGRRRRFADRLREEHPNLLQGLAELHSIWYDELESSALAEVWLSILKKAAGFKPVSSRRLGACMRELGFKTYNDNIQDPELYCLGAVVEDGMGSDVLLASIALEIGRGFGLRGSVARVNGVFGVLHVSLASRNGEKQKHLSATVLSPVNDWKPSPVDDPSATEVWSTGSVLKYVAAMLFANAACSEAPRYIQILAACLAGRRECESVEDILPYPFGNAKPRFGNEKW